MDFMKNWIIKKLGGYIETDIEIERIDSLMAIDRAKEKLREELRVIPVQVRGDYPDINKGLEGQKAFIDAMCKFLKVENLWTKL
jgi:hypothetical protein